MFDDSSPPSLKLTLHTAATAKDGTQLVNTATLTSSISQSVTAQAVTTLHAPAPCLTDCGGGGGGPNFGATPELDSIAWWDHRSPGDVKQGSTRMLPTFDLRHAPAERAECPVGQLVLAIEVPPQPR